MTTFDLDKTTQLLIPRVGFRNVIANKEYWFLDSSLIPDISNGGIYVNSLSEKFFSVQALSDGLAFVEGYDVDVWVDTAVYNIGDRVKKIINDRTYVWVAKQNGITGAGNDPEIIINADKWESALSNLLGQYRESAAKEAISHMIAYTNNESFARELKTDTSLYLENAKLIPVQKKGRFVGVSIHSVNSSLNNILTIDKIGLKILNNKGISDLTLYLYHSSQDEAIDSFVIPNSDIEIDKFKYYDLVNSSGDNLNIDLYNTDYNQGGIFYFGFFEDDLADTYSASDATWWGGLQGLPIYYNLLNTNDFFVSPVEILPSRLNGTSLPDIGQYYDGANYNSQIPFNLRISVSQSYHALLSRNIHLLDKVYQYNLAISVLINMMMDDRINNFSDNAQSKIDELLYGDPNNPNNKGLVKMKELYVKKLESDMGSIFDVFKGMYQAPV